MKKRNSAKHSGCLLLINIIETKRCHLNASILKCELQRFVIFIYTSNLDKLFSLDILNILCILLHKASNKSIVPTWQQYGGFLYEFTLFTTNRLLILHRTQAIQLRCYKNISGIQNRNQSERPRQTKDLHS